MRIASLDFAQGIPVVMAVGEERQYLEACNLPAQTPAALQSADSFLRIQALGQSMSGKMTLSAAEIAPLTRDENLIVRRLALCSR